MSKSFSSLQLRVMSALVLAPIAIGAVYLGEFYFTAFLVVSAIAMCFEWSRASFKNNKIRYFSQISVWVLIAVFLQYEQKLLNAFVALGICAVTIIVLTLFQRKNEEWKGAFIGPLYIGIPILCLLELRSVENDGFFLTVFLFLVVWATDIGAYFAGRAIGGPKIAVSISPNKTWAGLCGGMISAAIVAGASVHYTNFVEYPVWSVALAGALFAVLAQIGDFFESGWKRYFDIKDASNIIPGHGGVLDRLDGVLFVAPALYFLVAVVGK